MSEINDPFDGATPEALEAAKELARRTAQEPNPNRAIKVMWLARRLYAAAQQRVQMRLLELQPEHGERMTAMVSAIFADVAMREGLKPFKLDELAQELASDALTYLQVEIAEQLAREQAAGLAEEDEDLAERGLVRPERPQALPGLVGVEEELAELSLDHTYVLVGSRERIRDRLYRLTRRYEQLPQPLASLWLQDRLVTPNVTRRETWTAIIGSGQWVGLTRNKGKFERTIAAWRALITTGALHALLIDDLRMVHSDDNMLGPFAAERALRLLRSYANAYRVALVVGIPMKCDLPDREIIEGYANALEKVSPQRLRMVRLTQDYPEEPEHESEETQEQGTAPGSVSGIAADQLARAARRDDLPGAGGLFLGGP